ncbi:hypothetical protein [Mucilaginibacter xinganensis]|uniref:hypothetical protein n=1 Tax=Mucilaginibacter xinganensis TaxID=1234841 RepID=UPI0012FD71AD|nr:hypothetical protein [Mucilaginibacter xinganensis]
MISPVINTITQFLQFAGIGFAFRDIETESFLPGLELEDGKIIIDTKKLLHPGDILHEAGHLATLPSDIRCSVSGRLPDTDMHRSGELMALAWSYAACLFTGIDPQIVFHEHGYKGESENILQNFKAGRYLAVPGLELRGMTYGKKKSRRT